MFYRSHMTTVQSFIYFQQVEIYFYNIGKAYASVNRFNGDLMQKR